MWCIPVVGKQMLLICRLNRQQTRPKPEISVGMSHSVLLLSCSDIITVISVWRKVVRSLLLTYRYSSEEVVRIFINFSTGLLFSWETTALMRVGSYQL